MQPNNPRRPRMPLQPKIRIPVQNKFNLPRLHNNKEQLDRHPGRNPSNLRPTEAENSYQLLLLKEAETTKREEIINDKVRK